MSHDNKVTVNTTLNNVVIVDSDQNQVNITHPVTRVIEVTAQPATTVTVIEETPNQVNVNESETRIIHVAAVGPQGIQGVSAPFTDLGNNTWNTTSNIQLTGSFSVSGSTLQTGNNTLIGNTVLSGSIEVSGSSMFRNSIFTVTGSSNFKGNINFDGDVNVVYSSSFYHWGNKLFNYGAFSDTTSQSGSANTAYTMKFNTNDVVGYGINIVSQSRITVDHTGLYNLQFSAQLDRVAGSGNALVSIWLRVTGSDVANSCTDVALTGNASAAASVAAWNFVFPMSASQYCELAWSTSDANIHISAIGTRTDPVRPAVPSVILTVTQVA